MRALRLSLLALLGASLPGLAQADGAAPDVRVTGSSAVDVRPYQHGATHLRVHHALGFDLRPEPGWWISAHAGFRFGAVGSEAGAIDLRRAQVRYAGEKVSFALGRLVDGPARGRLRLDGAALTFGEARGAARVRAWVGHLWHPDLAWGATPTVGGGAELILRPPSRLGGRWTGATITLGGDMRGTGGLPVGRLYARGDWVGARGASVRGGVEGELKSPELDAGPLPMRIDFAVSGPVGAKLDLGGEVRWEGIAPAFAPESASTPMRYLAPDGYGVVRAHAKLRLGRARLGIEAGPTLQPGDSYLLGGGIGRVDFAVPISSKASLAAWVLGAGAGPSWTAGGGAAGSVALGPLRGTAELAVLHLQGLNERPGLILEARLKAELPKELPVPAGAPGAELKLFGELAGGADRLLAPWLRGGVGVRLAVGPARPVEVSE